MGLERCGQQVMPAKSGGGVNAFAVQGDGVGRVAKGAEFEVEWLDTGALRRDDGRFEEGMIAAVPDDDGVGAAAFADGLPERHRVRGGSGAVRLVPAVAPLIIRADMRGSVSEEPAVVWGLDVHAIAPDIE